jgi:signal transduction histidine kinase
MRGVDDLSTRQDLEQISASAREMAGVISTLLDLARAGSAGTVGSTCTAAEVMATLRSSVPESVSLVDESGASTARIAAPAGLVARAVAPLLDNAARHAAGQITVTAAEQRSNVVLTVADDGPGVPDRVRETLFDPGVTYGTGGAGLGLGIARRVARSFGADITVGTPTTGAAFVVTLPRH